ncbi:MAG: class I SAM-dependent rRNA methyltransferase [Gammaproteobacteria bacterium]|nr:class I SAM-dependent rRNA methyltransferase [Gammaproteobacteria bacterium]
MSYARLRLKKNEERRIKSGHLWVYSNEIDVAATPLTGFEPGQPVIVEEQNGRALGLGYVNPHSLIAARLVSRSTDYELNRSLLVHRLQVALAAREARFDQPYYRLVYGESDLLPGLVIDRFGSHFVVQIATAGMERLKDELIDALKKVCKPESILLRADSSMRSLEGLDSYVAQAWGETPERVELVENGVRFLAPVHEGQKTGWFYDHRLNRASLRPWVKGKRVLDVFSYIGAFGVQAAAFGASEVWCVESSAKALDWLHENAALNGVDEAITSVEGDAFEALKQLKDSGETFDVITVDPPAFIKRKKDAKEGMNAYRRINEAAMRLLGKDGILLSASCSMHLSRDELLDTLRGAGRHLDRHVVVLEQGHQGPDHPVHPAIPETEYLKSFTARVVLP